MHIFISYAKKDTRELARQLRDALAALPGVTAWMDESIEVGGSWPQQIQAEIDRCDLMIVLLSPDVNRDPNSPDGPSFVLTELNYALYEVRKPVVPVMAEKTRLPLQLAGVQYINLTNNPTEDVTRVIETVRQRAGIKLPEIRSRLSRVIDLLPPPFEWVNIPAGRVILTPDEADRESSYLKHETNFEVLAFVIAKYPITNAQYATFVEANGYYERKWWTAEGWRQCEKNGWTEPRYWHESIWNGAHYPVVGVSWYEAVAFCGWLNEMSGENVMLPTEQQWQRAAQGDDGRMYPWGNDFDTKRCNFNTNGTTPVMQYPNGASPYGVIDMSGNVWEWCLTSNETGNMSLSGVGARVLRGGSWRSLKSASLRASGRGWDTPESDHNFWGFRVVRFP